MEGRVHHHEIEIGSRPKPADIGVPEAHTGISQVKAGAGDGPAVEIDEFQVRDRRRSEDAQGQMADPAAEISPPPAEVREDIHQQRRAPVQAVPTEDAGLSPQTQPRIEPGSASLERSLEVHRACRAAGAADAMTAFRLLGDIAAETPKR